MLVGEHVSKGVSYVYMACHLQYECDGASQSVSGLGLPPSTVWGPGAKLQWESKGKNPQQLWYFRLFRGLELKKIVINFWETQSLQQPQNTSLVRSSQLEKFRIGPDLLCCKAALINICTKDYFAQPLDNYIQATFQPTTQENSKRLDNILPQKMPHIIFKVSNSMCMLFASLTLYLISVSLDSS